MPQRWRFEWKAKSRTRMGENCLHAVGKGIFQMEEAKTMRPDYSNKSQHSLPMGVGNDKRVDRKNKAIGDCSVNVFWDPRGRKMVDRSWRSGMWSHMWCENDQRIWTWKLWHFWAPVISFVKNCAWWIDSVTQIVAKSGSHREPNSMSHTARRWSTYTRRSRRDRSMVTKLPKVSTNSMDR